MVEIVKAVTLMRRQTLGSVVPLAIFHLNLARQVLPKDLDNGDGDEWTDWRGQAVVSNGTQVIPFGMINFVSVEVY